MPGAIARIHPSPIIDAGREEAHLRGPQKQTELFNILSTQPSVRTSTFDLAEEESPFNVSTRGHTGRQTNPPSQAASHLPHPPSHPSFVQLFKNSSQPSPSKRPLREAQNRDAPKYPLPLKPGQRVSHTKARSPSPEGSDSSSSPDSRYYSCVSSWSPSSTSPSRVVLSGLVSISCASHKSPSKRLPFITPAPIRLARSNILTPDSTNREPKSRQPNDVPPRLDLLPNSSQSPDVKPSPAEPTGLFSPRPTPNRQKLQCQGLTEKKGQCSRSKMDIEGAVYFCKSHRSQAGSPFHERLAIAKEEELARSNKSGQCQGLNRHRVQCGSPAARGSDGFRGFCEKHMGQRLPDRPQSASMNPEVENGADEGGNRRRTSTSIPTLDNENSDRAVKTDAKAVGLEHRTNPIKVKRFSRRFSDVNVNRNAPDGSAPSCPVNMARPAAPKSTSDRGREQSVSHINPRSASRSSSQSSPSTRPGSSLSTDSRSFFSTESPPPSPSGSVLPLDTSPTSSPEPSRPRWSESDPELDLKLDSYIHDGEEKFRDYIPPYLTNSTKRKLLDQMKHTPKARSEGYIYAFELPIKSCSEHMWIKIGCSIDPDKRLMEWRDDCPTSYFELRGVWPKHENAQDKLATNKREWGEMSQYKRALERLVLIELNDLAQESSHLRKRLEVPEPGEPCCYHKGKKKEHKEIFAIGRYRCEDKTESDRKIWDLVDDVVQRWTRFVALYVRKLSDAPASS